MPGYSSQMGYCLYLPAPQPWRSHQSDRPLGRKCLQRTQLSRLGSSPRHPHNQIFYTVNTLLPHQRTHSATFSAGTHCDHINVSKIPVTVVRFLYKMDQATQTCKRFQRILAGARSPSNNLQPSFLQDWGSLPFSTSRPTVHPQQPHISK